MKSLLDGKRLIWKSGRGRKKDSGYYPSAEIDGFIDTMIERGKAKNKEDAFRKASELLACDYSTVKGIYYRTLEDNVSQESIILVCMILIPTSNPPFL